jgi:glycosyltransferase involved in cell wall biosynthesis
MKPIKPFSPNRKICLGIVSKRYDRRVKGEVFLFELLQRLPPERVSLLFVGEGRNQDASAARRLGYEVECHEFLPYRLFPSLYQGMDFLLMLSNFEGGPANLPEAVGTGTPVICTRIGMVADMVRDSENGIVLTGDVDSDADRMASILSNEGGIYDRLATNAQLVRTAPTWDDVVDRHLALYRDIVQRRQDGRKPRLEAEKQLLAA